MNKQNKEIHRQILSNKFGAGPKYLAFYFDEIEKISESSIINGYKERLSEFKNTCEEYKAHLRSNRASSPAANANDPSSKPSSPVIDAKTAFKKKTDAA